MRIKSSCWYMSQTTSSLSRPLSLSLSFALSLFRPLSLSLALALALSTRRAAEFERTECSPFRTSDKPQSPGPPRPNPQTLTSSPQTPHQSSNRTLQILTPKPYILETPTFKPYALQTLTLRSYTLHQANQPATRAITQIFRAMKTAGVNTGKPLHSRRHI